MINATAYEIDFLPVGDGSRSGDAIALRFGNNLGKANQDQTVIVIDGGTKESGGKLVEHIRTHYDTEVVDLVIASHSDSDHVSGLQVVLGELQVDRLAMHLPWNHAVAIKAQLDDGRATHTSLKRRTREGLEQAWGLYQLAMEDGVEVVEPFAEGGAASDPLIVLSPTRDFYQRLLPNFRCITEQAKAAALAGPKTIVELWEVEKLENPPPWTTSAENNSSFVLLFQIAGKKLLFTADAGVEALEEAVTNASLLGIDLKDANFVQVPHHGSRRNVGPAVLNKILGPIGPFGANGKTAFVSAAAKAPKHPSKKVVNAFTRRGACVIATQGIGICQRYNTPARQGWGPVEPLGFETIYTEGTDD